jgi:Flp pilus assembly protein TadG
MLISADRFLRRPSRRSRWPGRDDRGSATLEITVLFPAVLLATFGLIQGALYYHARDVALAAATDGLTAARSRTGTSDEGRRAARAFLARAGGRDVLADANVTSARTTTTATVTVSGSAISLVPGLPGWQLAQTASGPVERFTRPGEP